MWPTPKVGTGASYPGQVWTGGPDPSEGSRRRALRPCLELLCTNMLSDTASTCPSTLTVVDTTTCGRAKASLAGAPSKGLLGGTGNLEAGGLIL